MLLSSLDVQYVLDSANFVVVVCLIIACLYVGGRCGCLEMLVTIELR